MFKDGLWVFFLQVGVFFAICCNIFLLENRKKKEGKKKKRAIDAVDVYR